MLDSDICIIYMIYTSIYRICELIYLTIVCHLVTHKRCQVKCNEIMRNTDENNINFANHNKLATNYVGKMLAIS